MSRNSNCAYNLVRTVSFLFMPADLHSPLMFTWGRCATAATGRGALSIEWKLVTRWVKAKPGKFMLHFRALVCFARCQLLAGRFPSGAEPHPSAPFGERRIRKRYSSSISGTPKTKKARTPNKIQARIVATFFDARTLYRTESYAAACSSI